MKKTTILGIIGYAGLIGAGLILHNKIRRREELEEVDEFEDSDEELEDC